MSKRTILLLLVLSLAVAFLPAIASDGCGGFEVIASGCGASGILALVCLPPQLSAPPALSIPLRL